MIIQTLLVFALILTEPVLGDMSITLHGVTDELGPENQQYYKSLEIAASAFLEVEKLFNSPDFHSRTGWFKDEENDEGDIVFAKDTPLGRMVTVSTELPMSAKEVMQETWKGMDTLPKWNQNINYASVIASPTPNFDVVMYGNNDVLVVSGRDFVSSRIWRETDNGFILASRSVELDSHPKQKGKVRAYLHLAGARFRQHPEKADVTLTDVVMLADLKGMLPKFLVNQVIGKIMIMDTVTNRKHFSDIKSGKVAPAK